MHLHHRWNRSGEERHRQERHPHIESTIDRWWIVHHDLGSKIFYDCRTAPVDGDGRYQPTSGLGQGPAVLMVEQDAVEFVLRGRNVFHGFIVACDPWLKAGQTCFIVDEQGR